LRTSAAAEGSAVNAIPSFSIPRLQHCISLLSDSSAVPSISVEEALYRSFPLGCFLGSPIKNAHDGKVDKKGTTTMSNLSNKVFPNVAKSFSSLFSAALQNKKSAGKMPELEKVINASDLTSTQGQLALTLLADLKIGRGVCLLGSKGSGKSHIISRVVNWYDSVSPPTYFPLYQEMTVRDMLQTRITTQTQTQTQEVVGSTSSTWKDSPLVVAARTGGICILDGIDRVDTHCLLSLSRLLSDGFLDLPNGERLLSHPSFRVVALSLVPVSTEDARNRFLSTDLNMSFHILPDMSPRDIRSIIASRFGELTKPSDEMMFMAIEALHKAALGKKI
jgi:MoxR-like ATPase